MCTHECLGPHACEMTGIPAYDDLLGEARREGRFEHEKERVAREYSLDEIPFITERDKEMFTALDLYDPATARHCRETYRIAKGQMEIPVDGSMSFAELLSSREGVTLEQFYRACLFHDIGKVGVPRAVIRDRLGDGAMLECMHHVYRDLYQAGRIPGELGLGADATEGAIDEALKEHNLRAVYLVPAREAFAGNATALAELQELGFSGEETLMDIIKTHEPRSGDILAALGLPVEADLAAHHHNYRNEKLQYPITTDTLHISVDLADMLHIADVIQALSERRAYHEGALRMPKIMRIIVEHVREGKIGAAAARVVLAHELQAYEATQSEAATDEEHAEDEANLALVRAFLAEAQ